MIRYMPASIAPWASGALLILVSALLGLALDFFLKELVLWVLPLLVASYTAYFYSPRYKLLAGLSYMILSPLILVVTERLHEVRTVIMSDGWINGVESIIQFFCAYWVIGCIPVFIGSLLGLGLSMVRVRLQEMSSTCRMSSQVGYRPPNRINFRVFVSDLLFGYFWVFAITLLSYEAGVFLETSILLDIPLSSLIRSAGVDLTHLEILSGVMLILIFMLPFIVVLVSLFPASYAAADHSWERRPLVWLRYMVIFLIPAVLMSTAAYIFLRLCYAAIVFWS